MSQPAPCPAEYVELAGRMADVAGAIVRRYFRTGVAVDSKADLSPVTVADREVESAIRTMIAEHCPGHGIIGEEHGRERADASHVWVIDPIDGTKSFVTGVPLFGTLIALLREGKPVLGVVDHPILHERWVGAAGRGTTHNGRAVATRSCPALDAAVLFTTSPEMYRGGDSDAFARLRAAIGMVRYGTDCYATGLLASGLIDLHSESGLQVYDYCALVPVIEEAGGTITDWQGRPLGLESDGRMLAAGDPRSHEQALALLSP